MKKLLLIILLLAVSCAAMAAESVAPLNPEYVQWVMSGRKGAGYAGGITSAAVDGIKVAAEIMKRK